MGCPELTERDYYRLQNCIAYDTTESGTPVTSLYTTNNLNQYTSIANPSQSPAYDDDGNMTQCSLGVSPESWSFAFNAENRLVVAESATQRL